MDARLVVVGLALLAGCSGVGGPAGTVTTSPTTTPDAGVATPTDGPTSETATTHGGTTTSTPTSPVYDCPYHVLVEPASADQRTNVDRTLNYDSLADARQREFRRALQDGRVELDSLPETWGSPVVVRYEDRRYYVVASTC